MDGPIESGRTPAGSPVVIGVLGLAPRESGLSSSGLLVRRVPFPRILFNHGLTRQTGILVVERDDSVRTMHFVSGEVVWAESSEPSERFSEWLVRAGALTPVQRDDATGLVRSGACRFGEALMRTEALGPSELARFAERFTEEIVFSAFEWRRGVWEFRRAEAGSGAFTPPVFLTSPLRVERLIFGGFARMNDSSLAAAWLGDLAAPRAFASDPFHFVETARLTERHAALLARLCTGCFSVAEAMDVGPLDPEETLRFLGALDAVGDLVAV